MPHRALVSITITIDPDLLMAINQNVDGKSQSERIRKILKSGYESHAERE